MFILCDKTHLLPAMGHINQLENGQPATHNPHPTKVVDAGKSGFEVALPL